MIRYVSLVAYAMGILMLSPVINLLLEVSLTFFLGYPYRQKGYQIYDLESKVIYSSRDVHFFEDICAYSHTKGNITNLQPQNSCFGDIHHSFVDYEIQARSSVTDDLMQNDNAHTSFEPASSLFDSTPQPLDTSIEPSFQSQSHIEQDASLMESISSTDQHATSTVDIHAVTTKRTRQVSKNLFGYSYTLPPYLLPHSSISHSDPLSANSKYILFLTIYLISNFLELIPLSWCHAPTLSQARDNRRVNPSGVNNTFIELAQGFQTPVYL